MSLSLGTVYDLAALGELLWRTNPGTVVTLFTITVIDESEESEDFTLQTTLAANASDDWTHVGNVFYQLVGSGERPQVQVKVLPDHLYVRYASTAVTVEAVVYGAQGKRSLLGYLQQIFTLEETEAGTYNGY